MIPIDRPIAGLPPGEALQEIRRRVARRLMAALFGRVDTQAATALPLHGIHRILVCHVSHTLGNTLLLTPLLRELQDVYPGAEVDVVTRSPVAAEIFGSFFGVRRVLRLPRHGFAAPHRLIGALRTLRASRYDLAIDPCLRSQSDRIGVLWSRATHKLGFVAAGKSGRLDHGIEAPTELQHVGQLPVHLLRAAIARPVRRPMPPLDIGLDDGERTAGAQALARVAGDDGRPVIGLFANATGNKRLPADWWLAFAARLAERHPAHRLIEIVPASGVAMLGGAYPAFYSSELRKLAQALSALHALVSADCGVMHLGCASGTPTIGLFRGTDPAQWGPYGPHDAALEVAGRAPIEVADAILLEHAHH